jgi:hypothetical protein
LLDALVILRHSIHQNSRHRLVSPNDSQHMSLINVLSNQYQHNHTSRYSYHMHVFIHQDGGCAQYEHLLERLGYHTHVVSTPVNVSELKVVNSWYYHHVESENCCGSAEFIKLYAYNLTQYPVVVHWDLDVLQLQSMDHLYDAIRFPSSTIRGQQARRNIHIQRPTIQHHGMWQSVSSTHQEDTVPLPWKVEAFFTRDVTSSRPWEKIQPVQGGFLMIQPSIHKFRELLQVIQTANFTEGNRRGPGTGWGGAGYGGFQGAMAYQGLLAYYYGEIRPSTAVELDTCRYNQVVADVVWRGPQRPEFIGHCRQYLPTRDKRPLSISSPITVSDHNTIEAGACHDCRTFPVEDTISVHYTACKKPWECQIPTPRIPGLGREQHTLRLRELTNATTCRRLFQLYFAYRMDIEQRIHTATQKTKIWDKGSIADGSYYSDTFLGYCRGTGRYIPLAIPEKFWLKEVYGTGI